jgi:hypothetical protein
LRQFPAVVAVDRRLPTMKTHTPAGTIPAPTRTEKNTRGPNRASGEAPDTVTLELDRGMLHPETERFIQAKSKEWKCPVEQAIIRRLDAVVTNHPPSAGHLRVTIDVDAALHEEVGGLLNSPAGTALFGAGVTLERRFAACVNGWMRDMSFALPGGSGIRQALAMAEKGGRP